MARPESKMSKGLLLLCLFLFALISVLLTSSSPDFAELEEARQEAATGHNQGSLEAVMNLLSSPTPAPAKENVQVEAAASNYFAAPTPAVTPYALREPSPYAPSEEAGKGSWVSYGSGWMYLIDGVPFTGWLTDTDGKRYYLDVDGYLYSGWLTLDGKSYYLDDDGIMQTGEVVIGKETYTFLPDGTLADNAAEEEPEADESDGADEDEAVDAESKEGQEIAEKAEKKAKEGNKEEPEKETEDDSAAEETQAVASKKKKAQNTGYLALTFDDGPSDFTGELLDCLHENGAKATFFVAGNQVEYFGEEVARMEALGFEVGNHSYSHADLSMLSDEELYEELETTRSLIAEQTGHDPDLLRPPYGAVSDSLRQMAGVPMILWTADTDDWESQDTEQITKAILSLAEDGGIILMHDIFEESVEAAKKAIPLLIAEGYKLVTISELAEVKGVALEPGEVYDSFY